jgi:hypothetical protein
MKTKSSTAIALTAAMTEVKRLRALVKTEKAIAKTARENAKFDKAAARAEKVAIRAAKKAARIAALEAKLASLKNPVGAKAIKAAKKPTTIKVVKGVEACSAYLQAA